MKSFAVDLRSPWLSWTGPLPVVPDRVSITWSGFEPFFLEILE